MLNLNYDNDFDVLYIRISKNKNSYGDEGIPGIVMMRDIATDEITGVTIFGYKRMLDNGSLYHLNLPINIDFKHDIQPFVQ
jgi:uncharacterized protein YuzE